MFTQVGPEMSSALFLYDKCTTEICSKEVDEIMKCNGPKQIEFLGKVADAHLYR